MEFFKLTTEVSHLKVKKIVFHGSQIKLPVDIHDIHRVDKCKNLEKLEIH